MRPSRAQLAFQIGNGVHYAEAYFNAFLVATFIYLQALTPHPQNKNGPERQARFYFGGEGEIRTHVPELPDHPISSRRRCDHFGTSPVNLKFAVFT